MAEVGSQLLEALIESVADGLYVVDAAGRIDFVNRAAVEILGYAREDELVGRPSHATIHSHHPDGSVFPEADCPLLRPRTTGESVRVEEDWFVRRDGTVVPVSYSSAPFDQDGERGAVVVFRDTTELRRALEARELQASRRRLVEAADEERRRLGRDLHDGAQQRLVNTVFALQLVVDDPATGEALATPLRGALTEARAAIEDLRELASGLHPAVLTNRGLRAAVVARTSALPIPVEIVIELPRLPASVEATAYFVVSEALTNVVKHARASEARVEVAIVEGELVVSVQDDGAGGASFEGGSGLRGLTDRVAALGGTLSVADLDSGGTVLRARVPLGAQQREHG